MSRRRLAPKPTMEVPGLGPLTRRENVLFQGLSIIEETCRKHSEALALGGVLTTETRAYLEGTMAAARRALELEGFFVGDELFDVPLPVLPLSPQHGERLSALLETMRGKGGLEALILYKSMGLSWDRIGRAIGVDRHTARGMALRAMNQLLELVPEELKVMFLPTTA